MYSIRVEVRFSALHQLALSDGSREPLHGHDWVAHVTCRAEQLDASGMVADFEDVRRRCQVVVQRLHYTNLNEHPVFAGQPTAERVAKWIFDELHGGGLSCTQAVEVEELPGCRASYAPAVPS